MVEYRHLLGIGTADNEYDINSYPQLYTMQVTFICMA
jgi:hypothetical protein